MVLLVRGRDQVERPRPIGRGGAGNMAKPSKEEKRAMELIEVESHASETQSLSTSTSRRNSLRSVSSSWSDRTSSFMDKVMHRKRSKADIEQVNSNTSSSEAEAETEAESNS